MIRRLNCPVCEKELPVEIDGDNPLFPFCSSQCRLVDLHRWLSGQYALVEDLTPDKLLESLPQDSLPPELRED